MIPFIGPYGSLIPPQRSLIGLGTLPVTLITNDALTLKRQTHTLDRLCRLLLNQSQNGLSRPGDDSSVLWFQTSSACVTAASQGPGAPREGMLSLQRLRRRHARSPCRSEGRLPQLQGGSAKPSSGHAPFPRTPHPRTNRHEGTKASNSGSSEGPLGLQKSEEANHEDGLTARLVLRSPPQQMPLTFLSHSQPPRSKCRARGGRAPRGEVLGPRALPGAMV